MIRPTHYDAVIFDLDGVVTDTARVHVAAWKSVFDAYLQERASRAGTAFVPFDAHADYAKFVDGKPRYDGVESFLASRDIVLARGDATDESDGDTACALGNRKDEVFLRHLTEHGVEVFGSTVRLAEMLGEAGIPSAIVTSSKNGRRVLDRARLTQMFVHIVDGRTAEERGLRGKPRPDTFLHCATLLGVPPERCVVVEDAIAGVQASRAGGFALTVGIDRGGVGPLLFDAGADAVVTDFGDVTPDTLDDWCAGRRANAER